MGAKNKLSVSVRPTTPRPSAAERRAAQIAMLSTKQAELKHEAAERRRTRGLHSGAFAELPPHKTAAARRSNAR
jgi:hypothetical protein